MGTLSSKQPTAVDLARIEKQKYQKEQEEKRRMDIKKMYAKYQQFAEDFISYLQQCNIPKLIINAGSEGEDYLDIRYTSKYGIKIADWIRVEIITLDACLKYCRSDNSYKALEKISGNLYQLILDSVKEHGITGVNIKKHVILEKSYNYTIRLYWK